MKPLDDKKDALKKAIGGILLKIVNRHEPYYTNEGYTRWGFIQGEINDEIEKTFPSSKALTTDDVLTRMIETWFNTGNPITREKDPDFYERMAAVYRVACAPSARGLQSWPRHVLEAVHSALDNQLGDSDIGHLVNEKDIQNHQPVQWAATEIAKLLSQFDIGESRG